MLRIWDVCISGASEIFLVTMTTHSPSSKVVDIGPLVTLCLGEEASKAGGNEGETIVLCTWTVEHNNATSSEFSFVESGHLLADSSPQLLATVATAQKCITAAFIVAF